MNVFQLHVLSFTIHTLLDKMSDNLAAGELDPCLQGLVEVRRLMLLYSVLLCAQ